MREGRWEQAEFLGRELSGMGLGLVGGARLPSPESALADLTRGAGDFP